MIFIHIDVFFIINIDWCILTKSIIPPKYFHLLLLDWNMLEKIRCVMVVVSIDSYSNINIYDWYVCT